LVSRGGFELHFLLFYEVSEDYLERRVQFRAEHLALAWEFADRGKLLLGGALAEPVDQAVLLFRADSPAEVEEFVLRDPYVTNGLVKNWRVREWKTVAGDQAANPLRP
jgi:uncharacterized protein YciI